MKKLVIQKLIIISQKAQAAREIEFDEKLTVLTGDNPEGEAANRTGKSVVLKSIYYAFGAQLKKYTANWANLEISTIVYFTYCDSNFVLYRNGKRFVLNNLTQEKIEVFNSIEQLRYFWVELFNFKIEFPAREGGENVVAYPGALFMPFYIDQDKGWSGDWNSFVDIFSMGWKSEILLYHLGIRTPEYYQMLSEKTKLEIEQTDRKKQNNILQGMIGKHISKYKNYLDVSIDVERFADEIADMTMELNSQMAERESIKNQIVDWLSQLREMDELFAVAQKNREELMRDADYIDINHTEDTIVCPLCGTVHQNSVDNKFGLFSEIQACEEAMENYFEKRDQIEKKIRSKSSEIATLDRSITDLREILDRKRDHVTFREVVIAEGSKSILRDLEEDKTRMLSEIDAVDNRLKEITNLQRAITKEGKPITDQYLGLLKANLSYLDVIDINPDELDKISLNFKSGGNDLPCAILAQVYTVASIAKDFSRTLFPPLVLDAIFQQEPAQQKINKIWDFVITKQPPDTQLIISTTELHGRTVDGKVIHLLEERGLLKETEYRALSNEIEYYRELSLQKN